jgi:hypothetical protein
MARKRRRPILDISSWAPDQEKFARFEALVLVTQRVNFIKAVLGLAEPEETVRRHMKLVCERHRLKPQPARGPGYDGRHLRHATIPQRYHCSLLLGWLLESSDGGIARTGEAIDNHKLLDRMLYCYRRYLDLFVSTAERDEVSFVMFYTLYRAQANGDVQLRVCENCAGQFAYLRTAHTPTCPICAMHRHARSAAHRHVPLQESPASSPDRSNP